jgi:hypothetical protein
MREVPIDDVFAAALPEGMDPDDPSILHRLRLMVMRLAWRQYKGAKPEELNLDPIDWLITRDADEAEAFQPAHDCAACQAALDQMRAFLAEHPDRWVVLGNLHYVEVWPE